MFPKFGVQLFQREIGWHKHFQGWSGWSALFANTNTEAPQNCFVCWCAAGSTKVNSWRDPCVFSWKRELLSACLAQALQEQQPRSLWDRSWTLKKTGQEVSVTFPSLPADCSCQPWQKGKLGGTECSALHRKAQRNWKRCCRYSRWLFSINLYLLSCNS